MAELTNKCRYDLAWVGLCGAKCAGFACDKHAELTCRFCGDSATRECDHTGQFVCGVPLCDECYHDQHLSSGWGHYSHNPYKIEKHRLKRQAQAKVGFGG